jgi:hypothetical protein
MCGPSAWLADIAKSLASRVPAGLRLREPGATGLLTLPPRGSPTVCQARGERCCRLHSPTMRSDNNNTAAGCGWVWQTAAASLHHFEKQPGPSLTPDASA